MIANRRLYAGLFSLVAIACIGFVVVRSISATPVVQTVLADAGTANSVSPEKATSASAAPKNARTISSSGKAKLLPSSPTPLKDRFASLQALANAGDATAARRLYHDLNLCTLFAGIDADNSRLADELLSASVTAMDTQQLQNYQIQLDAIQSRTTNMQRLRTLCDGTSRQMLNMLVPSLHQAAELGDADARACYLSRGPNFDMRGFLDHPEFLETYRNSAQSLVDAGLSAGDWKVVDLLRKASRQGADGLLAGLISADPVQYYRYLKLYHLGAEQDGTVDLDQQLKMAAAALDPTQIAESDAWAQTTLQQNFTGKSTDAIVAGWDPCSFSYDGSEP